MAFPLAGAVVGGAVGEYEAEHYGLIDPSQPGGWATILAGLGALVLLVTLWRGRLVATLVVVTEFLLVLASGMAVLNYLVRTESEKRPESAFWSGLGIVY